LLSGNAPKGLLELQQNYKLHASSHVLGAGSFGKVFLSQNKADPNFKVAIKVLSKGRLKGHIDSIKEEMKILCKLDHPNIVKYYETYEDESFLYLVMEYCSGGELFDRLTRKKNQVFNESEAAEIMLKLFRAINHCNSIGVVHRDIKPENIMYDKDGEIKLIDFGLARRLHCNGITNLHSKAGTPCYMAPEVLKGTYDEKCDMWALGVLLYVLVSGYLPFQGSNKQFIYKRIMNASFHFRHKEFEMVSEEGKNLIRRLLVVDPNQRPTAEEALKDPWFVKFTNIQKGSDEDKLDPNILQKMRQYKGVSALKKAAMNILVKMAESKDIIKLKETFIAMDLDDTGDIREDELKIALNHVGV